MKQLHLCWINISEVTGMPDISKLKNYLKVSCCIEVCIKDQVTWFVINEVRNHIFDDIGIMRKLL